VKRIFDVVMSTVLLVFLSPLMLSLIALIKLKLGSPVFYRQVRPGLNGEPFEMFKFRSMHNIVDIEGKELPDSQRMSSFGRLLRSTSMDELPELLNIFRGDMSFVGPRPLLIAYLPLYSKEQFRRHDVKPGITGWAQINGRNAINWPKRFELDVWYVDNKSFLLDVRIMLLTIYKVLSREGISADGEATMKKFTGNEQ
jgi:lipopolysaccharide/colanic/teichoic acid biosynthesis glycosyltransferase